MRRYLPAAGAALLFVAATLVMLEVRPRYVDSHLPSDLGDPVLNLYFLDWGVHELGRGLAGFWNANFYFPAEGTMTFADHLIGPAIQAAIFRAVWDNDVAAYNFLYLGSFVLCGLTCAWVMRQAGASRAAATVAGLLFAFTPYRFEQRSHLPMLLTQWIPLVLWQWDRLLASPSLAAAVAFTVAYILHVSGGTYLAYFVLLALALFLVLHWRDWRQWTSRRSLALLLVVAAICGAVTLAIFVPYLEVHHRLGLERRTREIAFYGADLSSWIAIERSNYLWGPYLARLGRPENHLFAGFVTLALAAAGALGMRRQKRRGKATTTPTVSTGAARFDRNVVIAGAFFFVLSFRVVYLPLAGIVPGLSSMRVPVRVYPFVSFALALLAGRAVDRLLARTRTPVWRPLLAAAIALLFLFEARSEVPWKAWPQRGVELGIYREIDRRPEVRAVLHLPIRAPSRESHYMYFSTLHWKPIANGYSGYAPETYREIKLRVQHALFAEETLDRLQELGITHVATHTVRADSPDQVRRLARWAAHFSSGAAPRLRLVASAGNDRLYELLPR